ncbi:MAG: hypothetical protein ACAH80_07070 [Alphaproteobacteria bacterium]
MLCALFNEVAEIAEQVLEFTKSVFFNSNENDAEKEGQDAQAAGIAAKVSRFFTNLKEELSPVDPWKSTRAQELLAILRMLAMDLARDEYGFTMGEVKGIVAELESLGVFGAEMLLVNVVPMHKNSEQKFVYAPAQPQHHYGMAA